MSSNFFINLDSRDRINGNVTNFAVAMNDFSLDPGTEIMLSLESCNFFNLEYPINTHNKTIVFNEASDSNTDYTITLDEGSYTGAEIATEIASKMTTASGNAYTYSGTYDTNNGKLSISDTLPNVFQFKTIDDIFGFDVNNTAQSFLAAQTSVYPVNLAGVEYIDICIPGLLTSTMTTNPNKNGILKRIPLDVPFGSMVTFRNYNDDDSILIEKQLMDNFEVRILTPTGRYYSMPLNSNISIVLKCKVVR